MTHSPFFALALVPENPRLLTVLGQRRTLQAAFKRSPLVGSLVAGAQYVPIPVGSECPREWFAIHSN